MDLASFTGSTITGGLLGGLFSLSSSAVEFVNRRQEAKEKLEELKAKNSHALSVLQLTHEREREAVADQASDLRVQGTIDEIKASFDGLRASFEDQVTLSNKVDGWTADVLVLFRPGLTTLLVVGAVCAGSFADKSTFNALVELSAMAVAWWFGDRQRMKLMGR